MKDYTFSKKEAMMILKAYEEFIKLDLALSCALDGSGIEDGGKYKNLWNLPMILMKYSHFGPEESEKLFSIVLNKNLTVEEKYELII
ncbi:hypothetical protein SAMN06297422_13412 [Lachnospiraceae bacterium]|nr:hypothetical protein SAMN06297422_13412 [Lachnospiraceae bacterium]